MTSFPKQIGFLVEGGADQGALPVLIACPEAFEVVFNHSLHPFLKSNQPPESYPDPKRRIIIPYLHKHTAYQRLNREISQRIAQTEACQVEIIRQTCPSFEQFANDLQAAFEEIS